MRFWPAENLRVGQSPAHQRQLDFIRSHARATAENLLGTQPCLKCIPKLPCSAAVLTETPRMMEEDC
jgi:hypothetical protein